MTLIVGHELIVSDVIDHPQHETLQMRSSQPLQKAITDQVYKAFNLALATSVEGRPVSGQPLPSVQDGWQTQSCLVPP